LSSFLQGKNTAKTFALRRNHPTAAPRANIMSPTSATLRAAALQFYNLQDSAGTGALTIIQAELSVFNVRFETPHSRERPQ